MNKFVISEYLAFANQENLLTEEERRNKNLILAGVLQRADAVNGNGRVYPRHVLQREVENYKKLVRERRAMGERDHPESATVNLENVSHIVTDIWWQGGDVMGKVEILPTSAGNDLKALIESDVKLGISSRGLGSTRQQGQNVLVEDDFQLICFDFVSEPSTTGAFMLREGQEKNINIFIKADRINRALNKILESYNG
jgi:hypothetical protein